MSKLKTFLLFFFILSLALVVIAYPYRRKIKNKFKALLGYSSRTSPSGSGNCSGCSTIFTDNVYRHELAYFNKGINPQKKDQDLDNLLQSGNLIQLETNSFYTIKKAHHSRPYVLSTAQLFIQDLSKKYSKKCSSDSLKYIPFTISSVTRSHESVQKLMNNNNNAIKNSAHLKGKTFDVSYRAFNKNKKQSKAFIEALKELRAQKRCFVKFERNGCLHITVI
jgi:hypothetical protein